MPRCVRGLPDTIGLFTVWRASVAGVCVTSVEEIDAVLQAGKRHRVTGRTNMNERSSRSHAIFTVTIETSEMGPDGKAHIRVGKLNMVDLAGGCAVAVAFYGHGGLQPAVGERPIAACSRVRLQVASASRRRARRACA